MTPEGFDAQRYRYWAEVIRVVDGDTLVVSIDAGMNIYHHISVRVRGCNAPEMFSGPPEERAKGEAARETFIAMLTDPINGGWLPLRLITFKDSRSFNRYVATVLIPQADGTLADAADLMIAAGAAVYEGPNG